MLGGEERVLQGGAGVREQLEGEDGGTDRDEWILGAGWPDVQPA